MLLLLAACDGPKGSDDSAARDDTATTDDTAAADCTFLPPGDRLVFDPGCVDGVCGGTTWPDAVAILGEPDSCAADYYVAACAWGDLTISFTDCDNDGAPDDTYLCDMFEQTFVIRGAWDGASAEGLGLGVPGTCWSEVLGPMDGTGWNFGENPWSHLGIVPNEGPVTNITVSWSFEE